jgi:hypothetical protein
MKADLNLKSALIGMVGLEVPICHQFLAGEFDNFFFVGLGARSDDVVNKDFLFFRSGDVDETDEGTKNIHFRFHERCEVGSRSARAVVVAWGKVASGTTVSFQASSSATSSRSVGWI